MRLCVMGVHSPVATRKVPLQDLHSDKKSKSDAAAVALGQFITTYLEHGFSNGNGRNGSVTLGSNNLDNCCKNTLNNIWDVLTSLEPALTRSVLRYTKVASVLENAPDHLHHATIRSHIAEKEKALMLSRQLHGVPVATLSHLLPHFAHLQRLDFSHNALTEDDVPELCNALKTFTALLHLDLSSNSIGEDGAEALAEALVHLRHLRHLCLNSTLLEDEGIAHISRAIATPLDIRYLSLAKCGITSEGAASLQAALQALPKLSHLDLQGNDLQVRILAVLARVCWRKTPPH
jgi:Leucine-rich repeat (LRR) protein